MKVPTWSSSIAALGIAAACLAGGCKRGEHGEATTPTEGHAKGRGASDAASLPGFDISVDEGAAAARTSGRGGSKETPVAACGAASSYDYIASDVVCGDGKSPFAGDLRAAMHARVGNVGPNEQMHVIDLYEVPCPEGPKQVFVDMYDCENAQPTRSEMELARLGDGVASGDFGPFIARCREDAARGPGFVSTLLKTCVPGMPAVLGAAGDREGARAWLKEWCAGAPLEPDEDGDPPRFVYLDNVIETELDLAESRGKTSAQITAERPKLTGEYARICEVDAAKFERWRSQKPREE